MPENDYSQRALHLYDRLEGRELVLDGLHESIEHLVGDPRHLDLGEQELAALPADQGLVLPAPPPRPPSPIRDWAE
jgi:hypothetical protein